MVYHTAYPEALGARAVSIPGQLRMLLKPLGEGRQQSGGRHTPWTAHKHCRRPSVLRPSLQQLLARRGSAGAGDGCRGEALEVVAVLALGVSKEPRGDAGESEAEQQVRWRVIAHGAEAAAAKRVDGVEAAHADTAEDRVPQVVNPLPAATLCFLLLVRSGGTRSQHVMRDQTAFNQLSIAGWKW